MSGGWVAVVRLESSCVFFMTCTLKVLRGQQQESVVGMSRIRLETQGSAMRNHIYFQLPK